MKGEKIVLTRGQIIEEDGSKTVGFVNTEEGKKYYADKFISYSAIEKLKNDMKQIVYTYVPNPINQDEAVNEINMSFDFTLQEVK